MNALIRAAASHANVFDLSSSVNPELTQERFNMNTGRWPWWDEAQTLKLLVLLYEKAQLYMKKFDKDSAMMTVQYEPLN